MRVNNTLLRVGVIVLAAALANAAGPRGPGELFPPTEPFDSGMLRVSELHKIYYELCGNPKGKPIYVLHGGPGGGCYPEMRQYFRPAKFLIVLHDQRGCGRSRPYAELRENNTQNLVADIERLRNHLGHDRIYLFGGSWGSTLALAYAEAHPDRVAGMVIRGVFTGTQAEIKHFYGHGVQKHYPDAVARLKKEVSLENQEVTPAHLLKLLQSEDSAVRYRVAKAWARYELKISMPDWDDENPPDWYQRWNPYAFALIENHYMANACFLEGGQLLRDAGRLQDIPITIVNGRYDMPCPPITAYRLHQLLPKSKLVIVERAGHIAGEDGTTRALVEAVAEFE